MMNLDNPATADTDRSRLVACALLLGVALVFRGRNGAANHLAVQLAAPPLPYVMLRQGALRLDLAARFAAAAIAVAALQLVPLPPALWMALPGGETAAQALAAAGLEPGWRPLALDPMAAALALLTVLAPLLLYIGAGSLGAAQRLRLLQALALFAAASAVLGLVQRITGGACVLDGGHCGTSTGLMINRNHHADLILAGMVLLPAVFPAGDNRLRALGLTFATAAMGFAVLATTSRMGLLLALPAALVALALTWKPDRRWLALAALGVVLAGLALWSLPALAPVFDRLAGATDDERLVIAGNTWAAAQHFWPWGSGYGSFVPVHAAFEDLDFLHDRHVVAAHNDYLQILLEGGLAGLLTLVGALALFAHRGWRLWQERGAPMAWAAWCVVGLLLVHSAADFPLRMAALTAVFALCFASAKTEA